MLGTHTHVPTADERILPGGTAFQCDVGMTGPHESILGRRIDRVMETTLTGRPTQFDVATGDVRLCGTIVDVDPRPGKRDLASSGSASPRPTCRDFSRRRARIMMPATGDRGLMIVVGRFPRTTSSGILSYLCRCSEVRDAESAGAS